jgi:ribosomal protein L37AE/L43A
MPIDKTAKDYTEKIINQDCCPKCKSTNIVKGLVKYICKDCFNYFSDPIIMPIKYGFNMSTFTKSFTPTPHIESKSKSGLQFKTTMSVDMRGLYG